MITFSKRLYFAIEAVLYVAYSTGGAPLSGKYIAEKQNLPPRYLEQMLQRLVRAGVLTGMRGPRGGYVLAREKRRITLGEICAALEDPDELPESTPLGSQVVQPLMEELKAGLHQQIHGITIADLCDKAADLKIPKYNEDRHDFMI
jgi:Rrf2 family protein